VIQMSLSMKEPASPRIEDLLRRLETCPVHVGTTLDGGDCEVCAIQSRPPVERPLVERSHELPSKA
jgi:hypothetical protein